MLSLLVQRRDISVAQEALKGIMREEYPGRERRDISFRPRVLAQQQIWTCRDRYWYRHGVLKGRDVTSPRFQNWFGVLAPGNLHITVEVSVVLEWGIGRSEGFFARDDSTGALYLMHTGNVGGGTTGVGGRAFRAWYGKRQVPVIDPKERVRFGFVVVPIGASDPTRSARSYGDSIEAFKAAVEADEVDVEDREFRDRMQEFDDFYKEPRGRRTGYRPGKIDYLSRHGEVVDSLHAWRKNARRLTRNQRIVKNVFIDLGVSDGANNLVEVYEIKTSWERSDVYTAIGQLMVHGSDHCKKFLLLPKGRRLPTDLADALQRNKIKLLRFTLNNRGAKIL